jgi:dihydrofolate reductase
MSKISIIVAMDSKRGIGKENGLMWHIPEELKRFQQITTGYPIIMGRKTFESIGKALPRRTNIIITRDEDFAKDHPELDQGSTVMIVHSLDEAIKQAQIIDQDEIFIIGGGQIYQQSLALADKIYLTVVEGDLQADVFFPEFEDKFKKVSESEVQESNGYKYKFLEYKKLTD